MIRNAGRDDVDFIYGLYMHPDVNEFLLYEPMEMDAFQPIFNDLLLSGQLYIYEEDKEATGMFKLIRLTHRTSHVGYLGGLAIHPDFWGNGSGFRMINEILILGKGKGLGRMELSATSTNSKAIRLYEKAGFQREGIMRKYSFVKKAGVYLDEVLMAYIYS